jgi:hypothetical protein
MGNICPPNKNGGNHGNHGNGRLGRPYMVEAGAERPAHASVSLSGATTAAYGAAASSMGPGAFGMVRAGPLGHGNGLESSPSQMGLANQSRQSGAVRAG